MTHRAYITRLLPPPALQMLRDAGFIADIYSGDYAPPREELLRSIVGCAGIIATVMDRVDDEFLAAAGPQLRIVANYAVGFDNIDVAACRRHGVVATNTPGVLTEATADLTWALILAAARRLHEAQTLLRGGGWKGLTPTQLLGLELRGATLGVIGAGRIGGAVAMRAAGFGMDLLYAGPRRNEPLERAFCAARAAADAAPGLSDSRVGGANVAAGAKSTPCRFASLDELLAESDVVTLHAPMRPENRHMIDAARLARMKKTAVFVNTARGALVDEAALVEALAAGRIAAAGLDVYEREPQLAPGLVDLPNVVLLPHIGSATETTRRRMSQMAAANVIAVLSGQAALNPITT